MHATRAAQGYLLPSGGQEGWRHAILPIVTGTVERAVLAFFGNLLALFVCLLDLHAWERCARIPRGLVISAGAQGQAAAVRQLGASPWRVCGRHVLPNFVSTLIVSMTLAFPEIIPLKSGPSFLGLGVQPPETSLGSMVGYGREYLARAP
ncbi:ABC transporter permease subunit [Belnapia arida]|nr:ABC transporter permease subunit [Belnapia arida]